MRPIFLCERAIEARYARPADLVLPAGSFYDRAQEHGLAILVDDRDVQVGVGGPFGPFLGVLGEILVAAIGRVAKDHVVSGGVGHADDEGRRGAVLDVALEELVEYGRQGLRTNREPGHRARLIAL